MFTTNAYERELRMSEVCMDMTDRGIRCDVERLDRDSKIWIAQNAELDSKIRGRLGCGESVNLASGEQLADALEAAGKVTEWVRTAPSEAHPEGCRSVAADSLKVCCNDAELVGMLETLAIVDTCISTFALPWLEMAKHDGRLHVQWNSTRRDKEGGGTFGARTLRLSSTPNLQNIIRPEKLKRTDLPYLRRYLIPSEGKVFLGRDYASQEFRGLAHFEDGPLLEAFQQDPKLDLHALVMRLIEEKFGIVVIRDHVKIIGFGLLYGMGIGKLAKTMGVSLDEAKRIRDAYLSVISGVPLLIKLLKARAKAGEPIRTVGGRLYYCEPPRTILSGKRRGQIQTFDYKLLNYLIQGSCADITKQAMINADDAGLELLLTVHDELLIEAPISEEKEAMEKLRDAMERVPLDVLLLSEGKRSLTNWGEMTKYDDYRMAA